VGYGVAITRTVAPDMTSVSFSFSAILMVQSLEKELMMSEGTPFLGSSAVHAWLSQKLT
jgi:hypothetical protein